jgi:hypothetical protein
MLGRVVPIFFFGSPSVAYIQMPLSFNYQDPLFTKSAYYCPAHFLSQACLIVFRHRHVLLLTEQSLHLLIVLLLLFSKPDSLFSLAVYLLNTFNFHPTFLLFSTLSLSATQHITTNLHFLTGQTSSYDTQSYYIKPPTISIMRVNTNAHAAALVLLASSYTAQAHTWMESIRRIGSDGSFVGPVGYQRGFIARGPGFSDDHMVYRLTGPSVPDSAPMCKDSQKSGMQGSYAKLQAAPKDFIALQYLENGHVTKPLNPRPFGNGTVYVYGTKKPSDSSTFNAIHKKWNADGTGGDKTGKLLATRFYDDGKCFQVNPAEPISANRMASSGIKTEVPCQTDVQLPEDAGTSGDYTLYWVWDYALMDASGKQATAEFYTACMDIAMSSSPSTAAGPAAAAADSNGALAKAIPEQLKNAFLANPTAPMAMTPQAFDAPQPAPAGGNTGGNGGGSGESKPSTSAAPQATQSTPPQAPQPPKPTGAVGQGPVTVTITQQPVSTVYVTGDPASKVPGATAAPGSPAVVVPGPPGVVAPGPVFVSDRPTAGLPTPTGAAPSMVTSIRPGTTSVQSGAPSVVPFTKKANNVAARAEATPTTRSARAFRRWNS